MRAHAGKQPVRRARVALSPENVRQLLRGESLHIRLRNILGEEQILDMESPCTPPSSQSVQAMAQDLMDTFDSLMNITGKGGKLQHAKNNGRRKR